MDAPLIDPPDIDTKLELWVDMLPKPVMSVLGIVEDAVRAEVPVPLTYPVNVTAPVPPESTAKGADNPLMVPPVIATAFAFCVDIVPKPVMSVLGMLATPVTADVPLPFR